MHVTGACHCDAVSFSAEVDEERVIVCHCTDCQILASSAFRVGALVRRETFAIQGLVSEYDKVGSSGGVRRMVFCPTCATSIYSYAVADSVPFISLRLGAVRQFRELRPRLQIWRRSALPWLDALASVPACAEQEGIADAIARGALEDPE